MIATLVVNRLRSRLVDDPVTDCQNWTGAKNQKGYGRIGIDGRLFSTHRVAYEIAKGPIPSGLVIDHLCRNPACCNADHLEAVTLLENTRRGNSGLKDAIKTHCPHGHEYTPENTYIPPGLRERRCRACIAARPPQHRSPEYRERRAVYMAAYYRRRKAASKADRTGEGLRPFASEAQRKSEGEL